MKFCWEGEGEHVESGFDYMYPHLSSAASKESIDEVCQRLKILGCEEVFCLSDIITSNADLSERIRPFLNGFFIVPNLRPTLLDQIPEDLNFQAICSRDGKTLIKKVEGGLVLSCSSGEIGLGLIERTNKIEKLKIDLAERKELSHKLEEKLELLENGLESKKEEFETTRAQLMESKTNFAAKKSALESKLENLESGSSRLEILKNRKAEVSKLKLEIIEKDESLQNNFEKLEKEIKAAVEDLDELNEEFTSRKETFEQLKEDFLEKEIGKKILRRTSRSL